MKQDETIEVRQASVSDADGVICLARALAQHVADPDPGDGVEPLLIAVFSPDPWCECLVAVTAGAVVGFVLFCRRFEAHTGLRSLWIADLAVTANSRGRGVGHALLDSVRRRAGELGAVSISLEVWKGNQGALQFYAKAGAIALDDRYTFEVTAKTDGRTYVL